MKYFLHVLIVASASLAFGQTPATDSVVPTEVPEVPAEVPEVPAEVPEVPEVPEVSSGQGDVPVPEGAEPSTPSVSTEGPKVKTYTPIQPKAPLTEEEMKVLDELEDDFTRFEEIAKEQSDLVKRTLRQEFNVRKKALENRYSKRETQIRSQKRKQDLRLIALLERFIEEHPSDLKHTPDSMFRLAQLYLSEAEFAVTLKEEQADAGIDLGEEDLTADYTEALEMWQRVVVEFPKYRQMPAVLYMMAHYGRASDERKALQVYLSLTCHNLYKPLDQPPRELTREEVQANVSSRVIADPYKDCEPYPGADDALLLHAWARGVGPHHFNMPGELDHALSAFRRVTQMKESPLYMEALYNQAWTYYRRDFLKEAIKGFDESVVLYDNYIAKGEKPPLELKEEALQYIAVAFTDPWEGEVETDPDKALARLTEYYKGREQEAHTRDIWRTAGQAFMDLQAYDQAIAAYLTALDKPWHLHPENPVVHQEVVDAYEAKGDKFAADAAAGELATKYAKGTEWHVANEKNREAMENYHRIGERMLYASARNLHTAATEARQGYEESDPKVAEDKTEYMALYEKAGQLYERFIKQYPESDHVYEFMYALAETKFFSGKYLESVEYYAWVRDHKQLSEKYFEPAALSVIQAYEAQVKIEVAAGRLKQMQVPDAAALKALPQPITAQEIPDLYTKLQNAWDSYQKMVTDPRTAPTMGLNAALVSVSYLHLGDAEKRFEIVMDRFCGSDAATRAKNGILAVMDAQGRTDEFQKTNEKFIAKKCGDKEAIAKALSQNRSLEFRKAGALFQAEEYDGAANQYYKYFKTAPTDDKDLPTALYNAALALRKANKPRSSIALLEEFTKSNNKAFRESPFYLEALRQTAKSYQSAYDYRKAVDIYLDLYEKAKAAKAQGLTPPPDPLDPSKRQDFDVIKLDALYNAASLSELDRNFRKSVSLYTKYEKEETNRTKADGALWSIARIYRASGDTRRLGKAYDAWRKKYGNDKGNEDKYVRSYYHQAELAKEKGKNADSLRSDTMKAWKRRGSIKGGEGAKLAGRYELYFAEKHYNSKWSGYVIKTRAKDSAGVQKLINKIRKERDKAGQKYLDLDKYGVLDLTMAAKVRFGDVLSEFGPKVMELPTPKKIEALDNANPDLDILVKYEGGLASMFEPDLLKAKNQWETVVDVSKKNGISNEWTQRAAENLTREFPDEFNVLHQEIVDGTDRP